MPPSPFIGFAVEGVVGGTTVDYGDVLKLHITSEPGPRLGYVKMRCQALSREGAEAALANKVRCEDGECAPCNPERPCGPRPPPPDVQPGVDMWLEVRTTNAQFPTATQFSFSDRTVGPIVVLPFTSSKTVADYCEELTPIFNAIQTAKLGFHLYHVRDPASPFGLADKVIAIPVLGQVEAPLPPP